MDVQMGCQNKQKIQQYMVRGEVNCPWYRGLGLEFMVDWTPLPEQNDRRLWKTLPSLVLRVWSVNTKEW